MKLKELINVLDRDTVICICSDLGPHTEVKPLNEISIKSVLYDLEAEVERVYIDNNDGSLTIEISSDIYSD